jgi:CYTH domain-containing protein
MMQLFTERSLRKYRYHIPHEGRLWEVDVFQDKLAGLIIAELEVNSEDESFALPDWVSHDVSDDPQYFNSVLIEKC